MGARRTMGRVCASCIVREDRWDAIWRSKPDSRTLAIDPEARVRSVRSDEYVVAPWGRKVVGVFDVRG